MYQKSLVCRAALVFLALGFVLSVGCGDRLPVVKVVGTVSYKNQPLKFGTVLFVPKARNGELSRADIQPDGTFAIGTYSSSDGCPVGDYYVRVVCLDSQDPNNSNADPESAKTLIPQRYSQPGGSNLEVSVVKGMKPVTLDLE